MRHEGIHGDIQGRTGSAGCAEVREPQPQTDRDQHGGKEKCKDHKADGIEKAAEAFSAAGETIYIRKLYHQGNPWPYRLHPMPHLHQRCQRSR